MKEKDEEKTMLEVANSYRIKS